MAKKLLNPRGYLSWTQVDMWRRNRQRYISKYMLGDGRDITNSAMEFGKRASEALENGEDGTDHAMEALVAFLPHYQERERELRVTLRPKNRAVDFLGKLDTFNPASLAFREYKTGRVPWTQAKAEKHMQLHHYAMLIYAQYGKVPPRVHLDWAETELDGGQVRLTGRIESYEVKIDLSDVLQYMATAFRAAEEIDAEFKKQLKSLA